MSSTFSPTLRVELIGDGDQSGIWGQTTNNNLGSILEQAITGVVSITMLDANYVLTSFNGVIDEARNAVLVVGGTNLAVRDVIAPLVEKVYIVRNSTTGGFAINIRGATGGSVLVPSGATVWVFCDGTNFNAVNNESIGNFDVNGNLTVSGTTVLAGALSGTSAGFSGALSAASFTGSGSGLTGTAGSLSIGGNATTATTAVLATTATTVSTTVASGAVGTTQAPGTNNTSIATTAFVSTAVTNATGALGTMSTQNANNVTITGGTINSVSGTAASLNVGFATNSTNATTATTQTFGNNTTAIATTAFVQAALARLHPVGSIYTTTVGTNPNALFGFGTWVAFGAGRVLIGDGAGFSAGATGGSADATLPSHSHTASSSSSVSDPGHVHTIDNTATLGGALLGSGSTPSGSVSTNTAVTGISVSTSTTVNAAGVSPTNANLQPYVVVYLWNRTA